MKTQIILKTSALISGVFALVSTAQSAQGPQPSICTRACWGARAPKCGISQMGTLNRAVIHHTANAGDFNTTSQATSAANVRAVQNYHMDTRGWCDTGYHFIVCKLGYIFEGRSGSMSSIPVGAHDSVNANSFGFNWMGYFHPPHNQVPTTAMRNSIYDVIAWRMPSAWSAYGGGTYGGRSGVGTLCSHRDAFASACPGDSAYPFITSNINSGEARNGVHARRNGTPPPPPVAPRLDIFGVGGGNSIYQKAWVPGWTGWNPVGGNSGATPGAVSWGANRIDVFYRGTDNACWHKWFNGTSWNTADESLGGAFISGFAACSWGADRLDVFGVGPDNAIYHKWFTTASGWGGWARLPAVATADIGAVSWGPNRIDLFYRGNDGGCWHKWYDVSTGWSATDEPMGGYFLPGTGMAAASWGPGRLDVFGIGGGNAVYHNAWTPGWTGWASLGGTATATPGAVSLGANKIDVCYRGSDGGCWHKWWDGTRWNSVDEGLGGFFIGGTGFGMASWSRNP